MNEGLIPNRYAKALYEFAFEQKAADSVYAETQRLAASFAMQRDLAKAVENPFLSLDDKENLLLAASGAAPTGCLVKFFKLVFSRGRESMLPSMALAYGKLYRKANNIAQVAITTASPLPKESMAKIKDSVQAYLRGKKLEYTEAVDASLIGGFTVKVDSKLLDASISNELRKLRLKLLSNK